MRWEITMRLLCGFSLQKRFQVGVLESRRRFVPGRRGRLLRSLKHLWGDHDFRIFSTIGKNPRDMSGQINLFLNPDFTIIQIK
jgi:hypothetical protein